MSQKNQNEIGLSPNNQEFLRDSSEIADFLNELGQLLVTGKLNVRVLGPILRTLILVDMGKGYNTVEIIVRHHKITVINIKDLESELVDQPISIPIWPKNLQ